MMISRFIISDSDHRAGDERRRKKEEEEGPVPCPPNLLPPRLLIMPLTRSTPFPNTGNCIRPPSCLFEPAASRAAAANRLVLVVVGRARCCYKMSGRGRGALAFDSLDRWAMMQGHPQAFVRAHVILGCWGRVHLQWRGLVAFGGFGPPVVVGSLLLVLVLL